MNPSYTPATALSSALPSSQNYHAAPPPPPQQAQHHPSHIYLQHHVPPPNSSILPPQIHSSISPYPLLGASSNPMSHRLPNNTTTPGLGIISNYIPHYPPSGPGPMYNNENASPILSKSSPIVKYSNPFNEHSKNYAATLSKSTNLDIDEFVDVLSICESDVIEDYSEHILKLVSLLNDPHLSITNFKKLETKYYKMINNLPNFINYDDPIHSRLYILIEKNFDAFIKISTNHKNFKLATKTIRFLTNILMNLNYWEIYNLLNWKPSIYYFLNLIHFDFNACYAKFLKDYSKFNFDQFNNPDLIISKVSNAKAKRNQMKYKRASYADGDSDVDSNYDDSVLSSSNTPSSSTTYFQMGLSPEDHDRFVSDQLSGLTPKEKRKIRVDAKLAAHRIIKKTQTAKPSNKSSNYDPDVVHECQLPSADEANKLCLRRFSRKYELIRHQETVHSKKKKLFKCYVCVKQNPNVGPRIFTRHDTLAKHIRVNHKISGKEAKAEVAYSKKHAEVVEEGDITVHVGRRKTKVDFELRAHMEKKKLAKETPDGEIITEDIDSGMESMDSADETLD